MKAIPTILALFLLSGAGFAQSMNTSTTITLPNVVTEDKVYSEFTASDVDEELSADDVFDKMALIESLVFSDEELRTKREKHMIEAGGVAYFEYKSN